MSKRESFLLRLRPETMDALRRWADDEFRSVNGQIEFILARALKDVGRGRAINSSETSDDSIPCPPDEQIQPRSEE